MIIKLTKIQFDYITYSLIKEKEFLKSKLKIKKFNNKSYVIGVEEETVDEINDWAGEELQKKGFDENYELTNEGKILQELIDLFFIE